MFVEDRDMIQNYKIVNGFNKMNKESLLIISKLTKTIKPLKKLSGSNVNIIKS